MSLVHSVTVGLVFGIDHLAGVRVRVILEGADDREEEACPRFAAVADSPRESSGELSVGVELLAPPAGARLRRAVVVRSQSTAWVLPPTSASRFAPTQSGMNCWPLLFPYFFWIWLFLTPYVTKSSPVSAVRCSAM